VYHIETNQQLQFLQLRNVKDGYLVQASDCPWTFYAVEWFQTSPPFTNVPVLKLGENGFLSETLSFTFRGYVQSIDDAFAATKTHIAFVDDQSSVRIYNTETGDFERSFTVFPEQPHACIQMVVSYKRNEVIVAREVVARDADILAYTLKEPSM